MLAWLNELYKLSLRESPAGLPWDSVASIRYEYQHVKAYVAHHYTMELTSGGWVCEPKANWRETCMECGSIFVADGVKCASCADGL